MSSVSMFTGSVGAVAAILTGLVVIIPLFVSGYQKFIAPHLVSKAAILLQIQEVAVELKQLSCELRPNGGSTLRDLMDRVERRQMVQGEKQRAIFTTLPVGIFEADSSGQVTWVNRKLCRMTGRTPGELTGSGWINALVYEDRSRVRANWASSIESESEYEERVTLTSPEGVSLNALIQSMKLEGAGGAALGYVITVTNLEEP